MTSSAHAQPAILQIIPALDAGGAERTAIDVAAALVRDGFAALVASNGGRLEPELAAVGGELVRMNAASKAPHVIYSNARVLRDLIRARGIDLIHARSRAPAWSALLAARWTDIPFVATYHGFYNASNAVKRFYNSVMLRGDAVIANSQWTADHIAREYRFKPARLAVIPRGIDFENFDPAGISPERISRLREAWGVDDGDFVVLLPGRLTRWKGQGVLIEALALLKSEAGLGKIKAVLAGDAQGRTEYETELRNAIAGAGLEKAVLISGHISDMAAAYAASDVVVSASTDPEAFGRVAAEASAMAKPVIAANHGGARETVLPDVSGVLVPPGDAVALATAIASIAATTPDVRAAMGRAGRAHVSRNFSRERMCADTIALYRALISS
ncbi:MAG TPA: glycosyltransferase family 4 protein [Rhizomicrobium sp.]